MSVWTNLFLGPYAEWRVRIGKKEAPDTSEAPWYERWIDCPEPILHYHEGDSAIKVGRTRYAQHFFMPAEERPNRPAREMFWCGEAVYLPNEDWSWITPRAEIDWFSEAFQAELQELAEYFGGPPALRWGPLSWVS